MGTNASNRHEENENPEGRKPHPTPCGKREEEYMKVRGKSP